jgi:formylmethanofuran dehydrogenase subunit E
MDFKKAVEFHGHACFGLAVGYRASEIALEKLRPKGDEDLVAVVENKSCAVDAIQILTGCTIGKGNLIVEDYGKHVYKFIKKPEGYAVRIALRYGFAEMKGEERIEKVLSEEADKIFKIEEKRLPMPPEPKIHSSVQCSICGEPVMETKTKKIEGRRICLPCSKKL